MGGAGLAGFVLLPALGQPRTLALAAVVNLAVAVGAVVLGRRYPLAPRRLAAPSAAAPAGARGSAASAPAAGTVLAAFAISGGAALAYQVAWSRSFELFTGSTTYSFSLIACAFIAGLAVGGHVFARRVDGSADRVLLLAGLNLGIAAAGAVLVPLLGELPLLLIKPLAALAGSFVGVQAFVFAVLFVLVFLPTCLMGGTYPVAVRALADQPAEAPEVVGRAYGWNTAGAVLGAMLTGLALIPLFGLRGTLWLAVTANLLAAAVLLGSRRRWARLLPLLGLAGLLLAPQWNPRHMNLAPHMYAAELAADPAALDAMAEQGSVLFHEEGMGATVTVLQRPEGARVLRINGKTDASTESDRLSQGFLGHLPLLLAREQSSVMMIGLGSGMSVKSVLSHPVESVAVIELLPEVHRAATYFGELLDAPLDDPRTDLAIGDGRQALLYGSESYDAVISQPTNLFVSGISTLFTVEFFAAMRDSLKEGGVAAVWLQGYLLPEDDFRTICRTFQQVFPEATLWNAGPFDYFLVAGSEPLRLDPERLHSRIHKTAGWHAGHWTRVHHVVDLQRHFLLDATSLREFAGSGRVQHDRDPFLEFTVPRGLYGSEGLLDVPALLALRGPLPVSGADDALAAQIQQRRAALPALEGALLSGEFDAVTAAAAADPAHPFLRERQARLFHARALQLAQAGDFVAAGNLALEVTELAPESMPGWRLRAALLHQRGDIDGAVSMLQQGRGNQPWNVYAHLELARYLQQAGRTTAAQKSFDMVRRLDPSLLP